MYDKVVEKPKISIRIRILVQFSQSHSCYGIAPHSLGTAALTIFGYRLHVADDSSRITFDNIIRLDTSHC